VIAETEKIFQQFKCGVYGKLQEYVGWPFSLGCR